MDDVNVFLQWPWWHDATAAALAMKHGVGCDIVELTIYLRKLKINVTRVFTLAGISRYTKLKLIVNLASEYSWWICTLLSDFQGWQNSFLGFRFFSISLGSLDFFQSLWEVQNLNFSIFTIFFLRNLTGCVS